MALNLTAQLDLDGAFTVVETSGSLTVADAPDLRRRLSAVMTVGGPRVVLDLSSCDASGPDLAGVLAATHRQARMLGGWLRVVGPSDDLRRALADPLGPGHVDVIDSRAEALDDVPTQARRARDAVRPGG